MEAQVSLTVAFSSSFGLLSVQGKVEVGVSVSISTTRGVMKGTYTLLNPSAPLIWNFIRFCVDHSGYRGNLQRS